MAPTTHSIGGDTAAVTAGHVYRITNQSAVATAQQAIGVDTAAFGYRPTEPVWIHRNGGLVDMGNRATITTARNTISGVPTDGTNGAQGAISVAFSAIGGGFGATDPFLSGALIGFSFASATCANDIITGATPEPETLVLAGGALMLFSLAGRKRRVSRSVALS